MNRLKEQNLKVRALAVEVLGSVEAAKQWLRTPAMGLEQRRPVDLMQTIEGCDQVNLLLSRIQHGVYA